MNAKRIAMLTLALLLTCGQTSIGSSVVKEPFSAYMKRAELVFVGTLVKKQNVRNPVTNRWVHDLTFNVDKLIEGTPNIDKDTVTFCLRGRIPHRSVTGGFNHVEIGDTLLLLLQQNESIAKWMPRYKGLASASAGAGTFSGLLAKAKKVNGKTEYIVYMWNIDVKESKEGFIKKIFFGMPLPLYIRLMRAARKHPERIDPLVDRMFSIITRCISDNLEYEDAHHIYYKPLVTDVERVLDELDDSEKIGADKL